MRLFGGIAIDDAFFEKFEFFRGKEFIDLFVRVDRQESKANVGEDFVLFVSLGEAIYNMFFFYLLEVAEVIFIHSVIDRDNKYKI